ncbi:TetR/AcrR family transcriptional regulator [Vagococcus entomophilus]|uniref:HTH tetR-type domain-containing protein n=1 Tax=Vagococcus entomophilus TaxID=1160095 RepID=A0A430AFK2_9ENTE|nr:TetR/AcrR family transcriptional regulator [Vagococcus entomophilus]RSU06494.1 hypothetical protein CBF30_09585 [Vagococcus entomophilus]
MNHTKQSVWLDTQTLLLANHPFKTVTINQICAASKIHRSTFYRLFLDKFDLLEFGIAQLWEDYFNCLTFEKLSTPFQTADGFFLFHKPKNSLVLKSLILSY